MDGECVATFRADPADTYDLYGWLEEGDLQVWRAGISGAVGEISLRFESARTVTGRVHAPPDAHGIRVWVSDRGVKQSAAAQPDGRFELRGLPPGTWTIRARVTTASGMLSAEASVEAGSTVDLRPE